MRNSPMLEFPYKEFQKRLERLKKAINSAGLDGIVLTTKENTRYFSGLQSIIWSSKVSTPGIVFINADGKIACAGSASAQETARYTACIDDEDVYQYNRNGLPGIPVDYPELLSDVMKKLGMNKGKIGMEFGKGFFLHLQLHWFDEVKALLPEVEMVDASQIILEQRSVKSPAEIEMLRHIAEVNEKSMRFAFKNIKVGKSSEKDVWSLYAQEAFRNHVENLYTLSVRFGKDRFDLVNCPYNENVVIENINNAVLQVGGGAFCHGYYSDMIRTGIVGEMNENQKCICDAALDVQQYALSRIKPGISISELVESVDEYALKSKAAKYYKSKGYLGHGIGLDIHEWPMLNKENKNTLESGMVINIEPQFGNKETGLFCNEQTIAVTETGYDLLTKESTLPFILK